jgi:hypothetical protein
MAIAIGYEKDIILSSILQWDKKYNLDFKNITHTKELKRLRTWDIVAEKTLEVYSK